MTNLCAVTASTNAYYNAMAKDDDFDEKLRDFVQQYYADEILQEGKVVIDSINGHRFYLHLDEVMEDYLANFEQGCKQYDLNMLASAVTYAKDKDMAMQNLNDFMAEAVEWYFFDNNLYLDYKDEYLEHLEE